MSGDIPTAAEWKAHQSFYKVTLAQRDHAWAESARRLAEIGRLREALDPFARVGETFSQPDYGLDDRRVSPSFTVGEFRRAALTAAGSEHGGTDHE